MSPTASRSALTCSNIGLFADVVKIGHVHRMRLLDSSTSGIFTPTRTLPDFYRLSRQATRSRRTLRSSSGLLTPTIRVVMPSAT